MSKEKIEEAFDLVPTNVSAPVPAVIEQQDDLETEYVKTNMHEIIDTGKDALTEMADIAQSSQDPRAYRVLTELISALVSANKEMMEIKKLSKEIAEPSKTVEQNLFVGSTSDMIDLLKAKNNRNEDDK